MKRLLLLLFTILFINCGSEPETYTVETIDGVRYVHNLAPLWGDEPKIELEFVRKIGELEGDDENYLLYNPIDVDIDSEDHIFIFESGNKRIQVFDKNGKHLGTIGGPGQGPGEFDHSAFELDNNNHIYVRKNRGDKIQVLFPNGKYKKMINLPYEASQFKVLSSGNIVFSSSAFRKYLNDPESDFLIITLIDKNGSIINEFSQVRKYNDFKFEPLYYVPNYYITLDSKDNIYISYHNENRIEKYDPEGNFLASMSRKLNFEPGYFIDEFEGEMFGIRKKVTMPRFIPVSRDIGTDHKNRLWVVKYIENIRDKKDKKDWRKESLLLEVYNPDGILLTQVQLPDVSFDNIQFHGDKIYFMDPAVESAGHIYKIVDR